MYYKRYLQVGVKFRSCVQFGSILIFVFIWLITVKSARCFLYQVPQRHIFLTNQKYSDEPVSGKSGHRILIGLVPVPGITKQLSVS